MDPHFNGGDDLVDAVVKFTGDAGTFHFLRFNDALWQRAQFFFGPLALGNVPNKNGKGWLALQFDARDGEFGVKAAFIRAQNGHFNAAADGRAFFTGKVISQTILEPGRNERRNDFHDIFTNQFGAGVGENTFSGGI